MKEIEIALVTGDGAAPEMMEQATIIVQKAARFDGIEIKWVPTPMGWNAFKEYGDTLPTSSLERAGQIGVLFFGGVGDPAIDNTTGKELPIMRPEARCLLTIRNTWGLLINHRPVIFYPQLRHVAKVRPDLLPEDRTIRQDWLRFLLQDSYFGTRDLMGSVPGELRRNLGILTGDQVTGGEYQVAELSYYRREQLIQYFRFAFEYAKKIGASVIAVDKANVMPRYVFWRKLVISVHDKEYPNIPMVNYYVDNTCQLLFNPAKLNGVIICGNEHGDILSDGAAESAGSLGMMCSSAINPENGKAMFESGAGTAPTLKGQNKANPIGRILTGAMLLKHIGAFASANTIERAVGEVLRKGFITEDLVKPGVCCQILGTKEMGEEILRRLS